MNRPRDGVVEERMLGTLEQPTDSLEVGPPFFDVTPDRARHLRDGREAYPAMLAAIAHARSEILLEMYWIGNDPVGEAFRDRLVSKAKEGVAVSVVYDAIGSWGLPAHFWSQLIAAGGGVAAYGPLAPWGRRFRFARIRFRDHRKLLVVDGEIAFCGGINLARPWLSPEEGGAGWRDDAIEIRGPAAMALREAASLATRAITTAVGPAERQSLLRTRHTFVLANRVDGKPNRKIRRAYLLAIRRARTSIDLSAAYFLPGPLFLRALRQAVDRGVRVRILLPRTCDVWLVGMAMVGIVDVLLRYGIDVFAYEAAVLHAKTAVIDDRIVVIGSHNLDTLSWRYNLETNVAIVDAPFAKAVGASFELDLARSTRLSLEQHRKRTTFFLVVAWLIARFRALL